MSALFFRDQRQGASDKMNERTWEISDIDGGNKRTVTLAQYRAEIEAAKKLAIKTFCANAVQIQRSK